MTMMYKWVRDLVEKYEFVTRIELKMPHVLVYYTELPRTSNSIEYLEKIPYRATKETLIRKIERIKTKINYTEYLGSVKYNVNKALNTKPIFELC